MYADKDRINFFVTGMRHLAWNPRTWLRTGFRLLPAILIIVCMYGFVGVVGYSVVRGVMNGGIDEHLNCNDWDAYCTDEQWRQFQLDEAGITADDFQDPCAYTRDRRYC